MSRFLTLLSCVLLLLIDQTIAKRNLVNFQVYEEENVLKSELFVESLVDLSAQLRGSEHKVDSAVHQHPTQNLTEELFDLTVNLRTPIPMKIDGQLSKIEIRNHSKGEPTGGESTSFNKLTLYKLKLNAGELYKANLNVNHTVGRDGSDEFSADLHWDPAQAQFAGIYRGVLRLHADQCPRLTLHHNFSTTNLENLIRFASNVTEECQQTNALNETEDQMKITIDFSTLIDELFDFKLEQLFVRQANRGSETMTLLNKLYKITVVGNYENANAGVNATDGLKYQFFKKAIFESSMPSQYPSFQIKYANDQNKNKLKLSFESRDERRAANKTREARDGREKFARDGREERKGREEWKERNEAGKRHEL